MSKDTERAEHGESETRLNRRRMLQGVGAIGVAGGLGTGTAAARGPGNGGGRGNGRGPGGPPEKCECPDGTFLAKYDFVEDDDGCRFELAEGEDVIDVTGWDGKDGDDCEPVTVRYTAAGYRIDGLCAFGGIDTDSNEQAPDDEGVYTFESDLTNPGNQQAAISNLTLCGEPEDEEEDPVCPVLSAEYQCTTYEEDVDTFNRTGTRFRVTNAGELPTEYDLAVAAAGDSPPDFRSELQIGADTTQSRVADASVPQNAVIAWNAPDRCEADLQTWGEYKDDVGVENLTEWYDEFGTGGAPANAPEDFDEEFVVEVTGIPEVDVPPEDTLGPDEQIPAAVYPDMSDKAEAEGWITCTKEELDD